MNNLQNLVQPVQSDKPEGVAPEMTRLDVDCTEAGAAGITDAGILS